MSKIVATEWRSSGAQAIGIVLCLDGITKKYKAYIGVAQGLDEKTDSQGIKDWGTKLSFKEAKAFFSFPEFTEEEYD